MSRFSREPENSSNSYERGPICDFFNWVRQTLIG